MDFFLFASGFFSVRRPLFLPWLGASCFRSGCFAMISRYRYTVSRARNGRGLTREPDCHSCGSFTFRGTDLYLKCSCDAHKLYKLMFMGLKLKPTSTKAAPYPATRAQKKKIMWVVA